MCLHNGCYKRCSCNTPCPLLVTFSRWRQFITISHCLQRRWDRIWQMVVCSNKLLWARRPRLTQLRPRLTEFIDHNFDANTDWHSQSCGTPPLEYLWHAFGRNRGRISVWKWQLCVPWKWSLLSPGGCGLVPRLTNSRMLSLTRVDVTEQWRWAKGLKLEGKLKVLEYKTQSHNLYMPAFSAHKNMK